MSKLVRKAKDFAKQFTTRKGRELRRLINAERYKPGVSSLFEQPFEYVDAVSFAYQYIEIFERELYRFTSENKAPRILDCGANVGVSCMYFKQLFPQAHITAFEPDVKVFEVLKKNTNRFKDIRLVNKGLWEKEGSVTFFSEGADGGQIISESEKKEKPNAKEILTAVTTLSPYLKENVDFLKIDIEGSECKVLRECANLLPKVQKIFIEYHSRVNAAQDLHLILSVLESAGFRYFIESASVSNQRPYIARETMNGYDNLLNIFGWRESAGSTKQK